MTFETAAMIIVSFLLIICGLIGWLFLLRHRRRKAIAERSKEIAEKIITRIGRDFE